MRRSKRLMSILALGATSALAAGCVAHAQAGGYADADAPVVFTEEPTLVAIEPDVWVVRDYDDSVYYVDGNYWVYRHDRWYRSRSYDRGWVTVEATAVPRTISTRDHRAYVHYRGAPNAPTRKAPRERPASAVDHDAHRGRPEHSAEPHGGPRGEDKNRASEHSAGPHGGTPGHDDRPEVGNQRRGEGDDDRKREQVKRENDRKREDEKKDEKKRDDHQRK